jgi:hypothetical protein
MYSLIELKTLVSSGRDSARSLPLRRGFLLIPLILVSFAFLPQMQAVVPAPDGCYPGFTTAEGCRALESLTTGEGNTGLGFWSLILDTTGRLNTGVGAQSLAMNNGSLNTAVGVVSLVFNLTGSNNTAVGAQTLPFNDSDFNDAVGTYALFNNTDGFGNNAFGEEALVFNQIAAENTAVGDVALAFNDSTGSGLANNNTAVGGAALVFNTDGSENTVVGTGAGNNIDVGFNNTYLGDFVGTLAPDEDSTIRIGDLSNGNGAGSLACFIGGIFNNFQPVGGTVVEVTLDLANDKLGWDIGPSQGGRAPTAPRSAPARRGAPAVPTRPLELNGKVGQVEKLEATVAQQQKQIETLTAQLKEQAAQIQKVSAQVEMIKPAPRVVENR